MAAKKRPEGSYYASSSGRYRQEIDYGTWGRPSGYATKSVLIGHEWNVYKVVTAGGDRWVCQASSERTARMIAKALNQ